MSGQEITIHGSDGDFMGYLSLPQSGRAGAIAALRVSDGSRAWYTKLAAPDDCAEDDPDKTCHSGNWAAATAISGAVITGSRDGKLRAYSATNGEILWTYDTDRTYDTVNGVAGFGGGLGGAGPTVVDGMLYTGSGYAILGNAPGNVILAFGVPGSHSRD